LRRAAEEGNLDVVSPKLLGETECGCPSVGTACVLVIMYCSEMCTEASISLDDATESDLEKGDQRWTEMPDRILTKHIFKNYKTPLLIRYGRVAVMFRTECTAALPLEEGPGAGGLVGGLT
jgi:hypothetical protein